MRGAQNNLLTKTISKRIPYLSMNYLTKIIKSVLMRLQKWMWEYRTSIVKPKCRICLGEVKKRIAYKRHFVECGSCGFIYTGDFPAFVANIGAGMSGSWGSADSGGEREDYLVRFLYRELHKESFLLYGVGSTLAFPVLLSEGFDVYGCDVSESVIEYRQKEYGKERFFHVHKLMETNKKYDVIVACEVIEHFNRPMESIKDIVNSLGTNGIFCGTTNLFPGGRIEDGQTIGYMSLRNHVAYWSERSLSHILDKFGLNLITFEMICPGSVKPDRKYNDLFPNKRVFFTSSDKKAMNDLNNLKMEVPILPIDLSDYSHPAYKHGDSPIEK